MGEPGPSFAEVVKHRRMCRSFRDAPVAPGLLDELLDLARRAPSAGFAQGTDFVVLEGPDQTARYWAATLPVAARASFRWPGLLRAPVLVLPLADHGAYLARYAEPDKAPAGLGAGAGAWPVPYWDVDCGMATMTLLLAAEAAGLGALFFGIFRGEAHLLRELGVPDGVRPIGTVALGWPAPDDQPTGSPTRRPRRPLDEVVHRGGW